jgi:predicted ribosomally synthesized peptide with SipW-like signal peptide
MNAKRLILSLGMLVFVGAAVVGGTGAFFSDTETSTGNTFTAGEVNLTLASIGHTYTGLGQSPDVPTYTQGANEDGFFFTLDDIKPLDEGTITYNLTNEDNQAYVCVLVENATPEPAANDNALAGLMNFLFQGDTGTVAAVAGEWQSLGTFATDQTQNLSVDYCFGTFNGVNCELADVDYNPAQGGEMVVDVEFYAVQTRSNPNFSCDDLNEPEPPLVTLGSVSFDDYATARFRSFGNTGGDELYVGPENVGSGVRAQANYSWTYIPNVHDFTVEYDSVNSEVKATIGNSVAIAYTDGLTCDPDALQFSLVARDTGSTVTVNDLTLGSFNLGDYSVSDGDVSEWVTWNVSGFDFSSDFTMSGQIELTGPFSATSQENNKFEVNFGCL